MSTRTSTSTSWLRLWAAAGFVVMLGLTAWSTSLPWVAGLPTSVVLERSSAGDVLLAGQYADIDTDLHSALPTLLIMLLWGLGAALILSPRRGLAAVTTVAAGLCAGDFLYFAAFHAPEPEWAWGGYVATLGALALAVTSAAVWRSTSSAPQPVVHPHLAPRFASIA